MITDGLMENRLLFPRKFCNADFCECPLSDPMLGTHGEGLVNFPALFACYLQIRELRPGVRVSGFVRQSRRAISGGLSLFQGWSDQVRCRHSCRIGECMFKRKKSNPAMAMATTEGILLEMA